MEDIDRGISVVKLLKQVMNAMRQSMEHEFREMHLTGPQGMLMGILDHCEDMKISDLSEKLGLSNSTVSGIIDRLENQGMVERTRSKADRRVVYVKVSSDFKKKAQAHHIEIERKFDAMMNRATPEELETIRDGLKTLKIVIERQKE